MGIIHRVIGPPGTGKTTYLSKQIHNAVDKFGPEAVMVASFTKAAAREIASRIKVEAPGRIGTLHAICYRLLKNPVIAQTKAKEWNEQWPAMKLVKEAKADLDEAEFPEDSQGGSGDDLLKRAQRLRHQLVPLEMWPATVVHFYNRWVEWKNKTGYMDFTDLIENCRDARRRPPEEATIGFFDESQDFTPLELSLVRQWSEMMDQTVIAGDFDQCLYQFKGADPRAFLDDESGGVVKVLDQSYRVPRKICDLSIRWISQIQEREEVVYNPRDEEGEIMSLGIKYSYPSPLIELVERDIADGKSVIVQAHCSFHLNRIIREFKGHGIPFWNPNRLKRGDWNPIRLSSKRNTSSKRLGIFTKDSWTNEDMAVIAEHLKTEVLKVKKTELKKRAKEEPKEPIWEYDIFHPPHVDGWVLERDIAGYLENLLDTKRGNYEYSMRVMKKHGGEALRSPPKVKVGTIHSFKGDEADVVYVWPDISPIAYKNTVLDPERRDAIVRMFYVAFTRAREKLVLCGPSGPNHVRW
jgi:superfamily I DNA/RNA helicase